MLSRTVTGSGDAGRRVGEPVRGGPPSDQAERIGVNQGDFHGVREHYPDGRDPPRDHGPVCRFVGAGDPGARGTMASGEPETPGPGLGVNDEKGGA